MKCCLSLVVSLGLGLFGASEARIAGPYLAPMLTTTVRAQPARTESAALTAEQRQLNLESFEYVWRTIRDKHWDPKLGGLDWQAVHDEFRPRMEKAATADQGREVLKDMIHRLGQSHFEIIPKAAYREIRKSTDSGNKKEPADKGSHQGVPGFVVRVIDGQALVVKVQEGLPAAKLGVQPGWQVARIAGQDLAQALTKVREANKDSPSLDEQLHRTVVSRLNGEVGDKRAVVFLKEDGKEVSLDIPLTEPPGIPARFGNLPTFFVSIESRKAAGNIGYFSLSVFLDPTRVMKALEEAIKANRDADGFILDLRGNPGGIGAMAMGVGNWFVSERNQKLGTLLTRDASLKFVLNPRAETYGGPLAILVDRHTASTSEILAGGLQDLKRARIFGERTAGAALPAQIVRLPNGDGFLFAFANYISAGGKPLEKRGVRPDVEVPLNRQSLLKGKDAVLDAAIAWIESQKKRR